VLLNIFQPNIFQPSPRSPAETSLLLKQRLVVNLSVTSWLVVWPSTSFLLPVSYHPWCISFWLIYQRFQRAICINIIVSFSSLITIPCPVKDYFMENACERVYIHELFVQITNLELIYYLRRIFVYNILLISIRF
jgi:hypothetical protein